GSTGTPKGVLVTHGGLANLVGWHLEAFGVTEGDRATQLAGLGFDASVWEIWPCLAAGATLHLVDDEETRASPAALRDFLLEHGITVAFAPTPVAEGMLGLEWPEDAPLRTLLTGGDALRSWPAPGLPFALVNNYGPTENTVVATSGEVAPGGTARAPGIGRAVAGVRAYVLDGALEPAPAGVPGELYLGGAGVARGYLGDPAATAAKFVPDPFSPEPGARLYRTGDRARRASDGALDFLGRTDAQVKVRGFRVEPGEVEAVLLRHPGVREAAVVARRDAPGGTRLAAYVVPADGGPSADALRAHARGLLPEYMVPSAWVFLPSLPLTPSGKTDRRALPAPVYEAAPASPAPRTPAEDLLAGIWGEVLGLGGVGTRDDFFALGGHSLLATQVVSRVRRAFGVELPLRALFEAPTVEALARRVEAARADGSGVAAPPVTPVGREGPLPLSFAQERLWFLEQMRPGEGAYTIPVALRLTGALDAAVLEGAVTELVRRHEALRTVFPARGGRPVQVVRPAEPVSLPVESSVDVPGVVREEMVRPFDLEAGPVFRARLARLGADEHLLLLTMHHVVSDGWSVGVLLRELGALYRALAAGEPPSLPEPPVQYGDFAAWQRAHLTDEVLDGQLAYWRSRLAGAPPVLEIPADRPRPPVPSFRGASHAFVLPPELAERVRAAGRAAGATPFMLLLAAFQLLLSRYAGEDDVVVGTPVAGRTRTELEGTVGFFANTLALRGDLSGDPTFAELLARVRETTLGAFAHQDLPFERLVEELRPGRDLSRNPLFQVLFVLQNTPTGALDAGELRISVEPVESTASKFDLTLALEERGGALAGTLEYAAELFDPATVERMTAHFGALLEAVTADPGRRLSALSFLTPEERALAFAGGNPAPESFVVAGTLHGRFEAVARARPDAVAVTAGAESLTYAELDARADRLAAALRG
ncbi:MAG TPA: condensation domain-containing protein, partial [Longimicrobiaceae bacterium]